MRFNWLNAVVLSLSLTPFCLTAKVINWEIVPDKSQISFTAVQNNAPIKGQFKTFSGDILFSPDDLANSKVDLSIDMNSVNTSFGAIADTLKTAEWFHVKVFPNAKFTADRITKIDDKTYQADGNLTIRDKTTPASIQFSVKDLSSTQTEVIGKTTITRTRFGVGQGEWANTDEVKDPVDIQFDFILNAKR